MGTRLHRLIVPAMLSALAVASPVIANDMRGIGPAAPDPHRVEKHMKLPVAKRAASHGSITQVPAGINVAFPAPAKEMPDGGPPAPSLNQRQNQEDFQAPVLVPTDGRDPTGQLQAGGGAVPSVSANEAPGSGAASPTPYARQNRTGEPVPADGGNSASQLPAGASVSLPTPEVDLRRVRAPAEPLHLMLRQSEVVVPDRADAVEPIRPIPADMGTDPQKVALGRALFHDPRLSKDNTTACVSCHDLGSGGDDGLKVSVGVEGRLGSINAPTVFNAGLNFKQFWDGRADTLLQQIDGPVQSPVELGTLWPDVIEKLYRHESYPERFDSLYPDGINRNNVKDALAEYMKSLTTPNSSFDRWLEGDEGAISAEQKRGYALFKHYGCSSCHQGANVGGNMFQVFGVLNEYFRKRGDITESDLGRYNVTGNPVDRHAFKVPSLRMAALTAPYLHDGSAETLRDAVDAMFEFQLGREAPDEDKDAIVEFIKSLAGESKELDP